MNPSVREGEPCRQFPLSRGGREAWRERGSGGEGLLGGREGSVSSSVAVAVAVVVAVAVAVALAVAVASSPPEPHP
jgi:hypothetical protein